MRNSLVLIFFIGLIPLTDAFSQDQDYYNPSYLRYENRTYKESIKTVILERKSNPLSDPIIQLGSNDQLILSFDDLNENAADYGYRIIHCTKDWQPSVLSENDFTGGFFNGIIFSYRPSFNTVNSYYHYTLDFPNDQMQVLISGNYILVVYENADPEKTVLTRRFYVVENFVNIETNIHRATNIELRNSHQEVDVKLNTGSLPVTNPFSEIQLSIVQNNCWKSAITNLKPRFVLDKELDYNYEDENLFQGGSEFRNFDSRTLQFLTQNIDRLEYDSISKSNIIVLKPGIRKSNLRYSSEEDINGKFLIKIYDNRNSELEAQYLKVKFSLPVLEELTGGQLYLFGQLTDFEISPIGKMKYDIDNGKYNTELLLKQGYYNYQYMFVPDSGKSVEIAETEGQHFETRNDYSIYVYFRQGISRYDRLVGFRKIESLGY